MRQMTVPGLITSSSSLNITFLRLRLTVGASGKSVIWTICAIRRLCAVLNSVKFFKEKGIFDLETVWPRRNLHRVRLPIQEWQTRCCHLLLHRDDHHWHQCSNCRHEYHCRRYDEIYFLESVDVLGWCKFDWIHQNEFHYRYALVEPCDLPIEYARWRCRELERRRTSDQERVSTSNLYLNQDQSEMVD